jgi:hypothetical protein
MRKVLLGLLAATALVSTTSAQETLTPEPGKRIVEVMFILDTTGSMAPLIEGAKRKIWSIATAIVDQNPGADVRMGLVAYRDIGDEYVTKAFPITSDIQGLYGELLSLKAQGGRDWPESVNEALDTGVARTSWTSSRAADRILFLVGDAPPHMDYAQDRKYPEVLEIARQKGIIVNAVQAGDAPDTERAWRTIAQLGQGRYIPIPQDGGQVSIIETPFDREIIELQIEINRTILPYGTPQRRSEIERKAGSLAAAPAPTASDMASYMQKSSKGREAVTGGGDLVGDVAAGRSQVASVPVAQLPEPLQGLSPDMRAMKVEESIRQRAALSAGMEELVRKRDAYVAKAQASAPARADAFDEAVKTALRAQLKK